MHIFLTGEIGIGKSTMRRTILSSIPKQHIGGFISVQQADVPGAKGSVYLMPPSLESGPFSEEFRVKIMGPGCPEHPEIFETRGIELLSNAENNKLILMDEIGKTEAMAPMFCKRITQLIDGETPILGVLRLEGNTPLQQYIRNHPKVRVIEVTKENRDSIVPKLQNMVMRQINRFVDSAGAIVIENGKVLMISTKGNRWSFPKGHIEAGESSESAAVRETFEETGISIALQPGFCYKVPSAMPGDNRTVSYYLARPIGGEIKPQLEEVLDATWQPLESVPGLLRFPEDLPAFEAAMKHIE